jgi:AraC-like DNA-binding protein
VRCEPGWALEPPWSSRLTDFDLWFISEGAGRMRLNTRTLDLRPGLCFWMRPGGLYDATQNLDDRLTVSFAHFDLLDEAGGMRPFDRPLPPEVIVPQDVNLVDTLLRRLASTPLVSQKRSDHPERLRAGSGSPAGVYDPAAHTLFRGLLMELDATADTPSSASAGTDRHHRQLVQAAAMRITERPSQDHPVAELAREAGYSPDHFARVFKQIIGVSPQAYVIRARIDRAKQLLAESSLSISQIADVLGYEDLFFFSRQFKSKTGSTPRQYRASR